MMKKSVLGIILALFLIIVIVVSVLLSKSPDRQVDDNKTLIVSILPLKFIVEKIVGDDYRIEVLVPPGTSPETYEPTPQQLVSISNSKLIFTIGLIDFEHELIDKTTEVNDNKVIRLSENIALLSGCCGSAMDHHSHHHSGVDPHIWTSPKHLKIMADNAYNAISSLLSPGNETYQNNYNNLIEELDELDTIVTKMLDESHVKYFFIYHPAMTYYSDDYGIEQIAIEHEGKEPSADRLSNLISVAKKENIKTILYQREFNKSVVETIAEDIGAIPVEIDPLAENIAESIIRITRHITGTY